MSEAEAPFNTETQRSAAPTEVLGLTRAEWKFTAKAWGFAEVHASTLWYQLYQAGLREFQTSDRLPPRFVERALRDHRLHFPPVIRETRSSDGFTRKYLLGLPDGEVIETVLMRYSGRTTACVSSQVGCAMGCVFCASGVAGLKRHLDAGEIVGQVISVDATSTPTSAFRMLCTWAWASRSTTTTTRRDPCEFSAIATASVFRTAASPCRPRVSFPRFCASARTSRATSGWPFRSTR